MRRPYRLAALCAALCAASPAAPAAETFPARPIRIVTSEPTGGADFVARLIAQGITPGLGQQVVVENRGGGVVAGEVVARAQPDGHTLLAYGNTLWLLPLMRAKVPYDPQRDFAPVTLATRAPAVLVVHPGVAARSVAELVAQARTSPGVLNYPSGAPGGISHLAAELFKSMAAVDIVRVPFKGTAPALNALLGGQVHVMFATAAAVMPQVRSGRLRALAVTSAEPSPLVPGLPTVASAGLPGYESVAAFGIFAPARTPPALIRRLHQEITTCLNRPEARERALSVGTETVAGTPAEFAAAMKLEIARTAKLLKDTGIRVE
jgi:tripartite-type tricarboxylate transporter receptor subunit TctC